MKTLVIAEIGNNHNGSIKRAFELIEQVAKLGIPVAKFQMRDMDVLYRNAVVEDLGVEHTKDLLNKYNLGVEQHKRIADFCFQKGVEYMCTPWDTKSLEFLEDIGVKRYKIASADFENLPLIEAICETGKPIILSTGMSSLSNIKKIVDILNEKRATFTILHCNSTYPAPFLDIELNFIKTLRQVHSSVGYSGHERGVAVSVAAVALGAEVIERHITLDKKLEGPDHEASLLPAEFEQLLFMINEVEQALGDDEIHEKKISQGAALNKETLGKSIVVNKPLQPGHIISNLDIDFKSPGQGISPMDLEKVIGRTTKKKINENDFLFWSHFEDEIESVVTDNLKDVWGVPVRPHDVLVFHEIFNAPVYEFHLSYNDLDRRYFPKGLSDLSDKNIIVHAPELFADSMLLDICSNDKNLRQISLNNLLNVCDYCRELAEIINLKKDIRIVANLGGFSTHSFRDPSEKPRLYDLVTEGLRLIDTSGCEILPQNMAPYPWHFGGQRFQNIFMVPEEIIQWCDKTGVKICLDTAHLSMYCSFSNRSFKECFSMLVDSVSHLHISDAKGMNGEGVLLGSGDVNFEFLLDELKSGHTFIVETWQGHKNSGQGFIRDLNYLNTLAQSK